MRDEVFSNLTPSGNDVQDSGGQACLMCKLGKHERGERSLGCGLEHHGRSRGQGWAELQHGDEERNVPRDDPADHANWFFTNKGRTEHVLANLFKLILAGQVGEVVEHHVCCTDLAEMSKQKWATHLGSNQVG